ncbi:acetyl esterase [Paenibacillus sp. V4I9]|uniref:alpha/beta hydrolase n=1 Tax=Paenibacillus sp. V4I9 TaxID=3042308 RepID=UPI0027883FBF|nr:alpha/beta hydrolase [Paenibacillus sp. V4I9]MDQ0889813.1 acetyl esterase [Paenibacillus sp. V4I9]
MKLDSQTEVILEQLKKAPSYKILTPVQLRDSAKKKGALNDIEMVGVVENISIDGPYGKIPLRIYKPEGNGPFPVFVYFHGGGWVLGSVDGKYDMICRKIVNSAHCAIVSVDYHLAPEYKFPTAVEDAYTATQWVSENAEHLGFDKLRLIIGGDSAGANLAAVVTHMAKEKTTPIISYQVLLYPTTDFNMRTESHKQLADGYYITHDFLLWFHEHYLNSPEEKLNPLVSPILNKDFTGLPPALIITAQFDPLRDEGKDYADRLKESSVPVIYSCYEGTIHGFVGYANVLDKGEQAIQEIAGALNDFFASVK